MITLQEIIEILIMTAATGFIFMGVFKRDGGPFSFNWEDFKLSCLLTAPGLILHEMAHKFVGIALGLNAVFHAAYTWLFIGVILKFLNVGFIFFIPGYVEIPANTDQLTTLVLAFSGPLVNLSLFILAYLMLRSENLSTKSYTIWYLTKQINLWLFILNMLPLPFTDGFKVYASIWSMI